MVFSDTTELEDGLIQTCEDITGLGRGGISGNGSLLRRFTRNINKGIDRFFTLAFKYDALWNIDDRNQGDLPIATTNLVSGRQDYEFDSSILVVTQVFIKNSNDEYFEVFPQNDEEAPDSFLTQASGTPTKYKLVGNSIMFDKTPDYTPTLTGGKNHGIKIICKRNGTKFTYTDGAIVPGIPSIFHPFLARFASQPYLEEKGKSNKNDNFQHILQDEEEIKSFVANRAKPKRVGLRAAQEDNR